MKISHIPLRLTTGAYILNSGLGKRHLDEESAAGLQQMAAHAFPQVMDLQPARFGKLLCAAEIAVGATLLAPFIPSRLAGLVLGAFSGGLVTMYLKTPGMTVPHSILPSPEGGPLAKDFWMAGIAASLLLDRKHKTRVKEVSKGRETRIPAPVKAGAAAIAVKAIKESQERGGRGGRRSRRSHKMHGHGGHHGHGGQKGGK